MKVVIFGCQQIAVDFISFLLKKNIKISLIVTYELPLDKTYGYESVIEKFSGTDIEVQNPNSINLNLIKKVQSINPDIIFSIYYRKILPKSLLKIPRLGCVNIHPSLLPKYRGPIPTAWAIENGETYFGITIHYMDHGIDTGDILVQKDFQIFENETGYELYTRAMKLGVNLLEQNFEKILNKKLTPFPQKGISSYYGKKNGKYTIDWKNTAININNKIRVHAKPFNSAETLLFNRYVLIDKATIIEDEKYTAQGCGRIVDIINEKLVISCAEGCLMLEDYTIVPKLNNEEKKIYFKIGNKLGY